MSSRIDGEAEFKIRVRTIATGSYDRTIKWHVSTGKCLKTLQGHTSRVWSVAFSPNGHNLASGGDDHAAIIWGIDTGYAVSKFQGHSNCTYALTLSPNRQILASAHEDQTIKLWHVNAQQSKPTTYDCKYLKALSGHSNRIFAVAFSPDGSILASSSGDRTIKLWDTETWRCFNTFKEHSSWVWSLAFSPDGKTLASGSYDRLVKLWNIKTGKCIHTLTGHPGSLLS
ncbi:MAG: WD40 repeat domain-containing protein, partial [Tatlockia sp.]|nr:WD40 repeat domain-containing protein [Tatlockia sp.]